MGKRFVDQIWIRQRMDRKEARINRELQREIASRPSACEAAQRPNVARRH
jgi:hypothetical protein